MRRSLLRRSAAALAMAAGALAVAPAAQAWELQSFSVGLTDPGTLNNPTPNRSELTAGAHPDATFDLVFPKTQNDNPYLELPTEAPKSVRTELPRGLIVNPGVAPRCSQEDLALSSYAACPLATQVGSAVVAQPGYEGTYPVFNMETPPGVPAQFAFNVVGTLVKLNGGVRTGGDYGLSASVQGISQGVPILGSRVTLWGVPASSIHDSERNSLVGSGPAGIAPKAFVSNPGRCTGSPLVFTADATSWESPNASAPKSAYSQRTDGQPLTISGCDALPFDPSVLVKPTVTTPDSPTGLDVVVSLPQSDSPSERATAHLKDLSLLLPEGMNVNPSAADGLASCSPAQIALSSAGSSSCPANSALGSVEIDTPLLDEPLRGRAYLAKQNDNPFGSTLAMYLEAEGDGAVIKLAGKIDADPATGRLRVTFTDNPELPFSTLRVSLNGGSRAPLTTPASCGTQTVEASATPWSGQAERQLTSSFSIDCAAGLGGFAPVFSAGTKSPTAGLFSPLSVSVTRPDGQAALKDLTVELPPGVLAKLRGVPPCASAAASAGTCAAASRVGGAAITAGAGDRPFPIGGDVYLTGPYKGAPYGLSTRVRVKAGPLDLGTVVVRQALFIDPADTRVRVVSDPLPTILSGIPVRLRTLDVNVDRPGFAVNPTSCAAKAVRGRLGAIDGRQANVSVRFQVGGCQALPLRPKLNLRLIGGGSALRDGGHPALKAILTQGSKQSNLRRAEVKLPLSLALDPGNAQTLCEFAEGRKTNPVCPRGSIVGTAKARSPLLPQTLSGPVYFVKGQRTDARTGRVIRTLPTLVVPLTGGGVQINLRARTSVSGGRLVTRFDPIPDAAVSRFDLTLSGGGNGILVANSSVCARSRTVGVGIRGQNGQLVRTSPTLAATCG